MSLATNFEISTEAEIPPQSSHLQQDDGLFYDSDVCSEADEVMIILNYIQSIILVYPGNS